MKGQILNREKQRTSVTRGGPVKARVAAWQSLGPISGVALNAELARAVRAVELGKSIHRHTRRACDKLQQAGLHFVVQRVDELK